MNATEKWLYFLMEGAQVVRFHSRPTLKPITDGQHQHGVALICWFLSNGKPSANLLMAALTHDQAEQAASDMSSPAKWALGLSKVLAAYEQSHLTMQGFHEWAELTEEESEILNWADQFEGMLSCVRERFLGNRYVNLSYWKWRGWAEAQSMSVVAHELYSAIHKMWLWADSNEAPIFDVFKEVPQHHVKTEG